MAKPRKIIHIDMDCFYAAVEIKFRPDLKGKPVAVGGSPEGRGVLTTANYEARQFGLKSAMSSAQAVKLCPDLILIRPDFSKYKLESSRVRAILERYSPLIEPLSLDEAYLDVTETADPDSTSDYTMRLDPGERGSATRIAERIRREILNETGLTASAGVAPNKFLAKIASDLKKPNGLAVIRPAQVAAFMVGLPVGKIWGVGRVTAQKMNSLGIFTCGDLQKYSLSELGAMFGSWGERLYGFARGEDDREVSSSRERKSLSVEETYFEDLRTRGAQLAAMGPLYEDFRERIEKYRARGDDEQAQVARSIVVKVKFVDFKTKGHERKWDRVELPPLSVFEELLEEAMAGETRAVRLLGLGVRFSSKSSGRSRASGGKKSRSSAGSSDDSADALAENAQLSLLPE